jgi:hypothetical protein
VALYLHPLYVFTAWFLVKHRGIPYAQFFVKCFLNVSSFVIIQEILENPGYDTITAPSFSLEARLELLSPL